MSNLASKYTGSTIFTACIVYTTVCSRLSIVCWHFHTCCTGKIFGAHLVTVVEWGSHQIGPRYFGFFSILFYQLWGCVLYMLLGLFDNIFLHFQACILYTRATYTQVFTVRSYTSMWGLWSLVNKWEKLVFISPKYSDFYHIYYAYRNECVTISSNISDIQLNSC